MTRWPAAWCAWAPKHRQSRGEGAVSLMACLLGSPSGHPRGERGLALLGFSEPTLPRGFLPGLGPCISVLLPVPGSDAAVHPTSQPRALGQRFLHL